MEKIEKVLLDLQFIYREITYCSAEDLEQFKSAFKAVEQHFADGISADNEDLWFEIYKSVAPNKDSVEREIEH